MKPLTIRVLYSCVLCGLRRVPCEVPERADEDVVAWMEMVGRALSADHDRRSPGCHPESLSEVMIPIAGTEKIGVGPRQ